jgi:hypothetical protein
LVQVRGNTLALDTDTWRTIGECTTPQTSKVAASSVIQVSTCTQPGSQAHTQPNICVLDMHLPMGRTHSACWQPHAKARSLQPQPASHPCPSSSPSPHCHSHPPRQSPADTVSVCVRWVRQDDNWRGPGEQASELVAGSPAEATRRTPRRTSPSLPRQVTHAGTAGDPPSHLTTPPCRKQARPLQQCSPQCSHGPHLIHSPPRVLPYAQS